MNVAESLKALASYPIPSTFIANVLAEMDIDAKAEADAVMRKCPGYIKAKAGVYNFLATAPNVSQNGISYSFASEDKAFFKKKAAELLDSIDDGDGGLYGYQGDSF